MVSEHIRKYILRMKHIIHSPIALRTFLFLLISMVFALLNAVPSRSENCGCPSFQAKYVEFGIAVQSGKRDAMESIRREVLAMNTPLCSAYAINLRAHIALFDGELDSARNYASAERTQLDNTQCNDKNYSYSEFLLAYLAGHQGDYAGAVKHSLNEAEIHLQRGDTTNYLTGIFNVSQILLQIGDYKRAIELLNKADKMMSSFGLRTNDTYGKLHLTKCMTSAYRHAYTTTLSKDHLQQWKLWTERDVEENRQYKIPHNLISCYINKASLERVLGHYTAAILYGDSALNVVSTTPPRNKSEIHGIMSDCYSLLGNHADALRYADSSVRYSIISVSPDVQKTAYNRLYTVSKNAKLYKQALEAFEMSTSIGDSLTNVEQAENVRSLELKYEKAKNEQEIRDLAQQQEISTLNNRLLLALLVGLAVLAGALVLLFRQKTIRDKQILLEAEQRLQRVRINPHFFFNALGSLQRYALVENDAMLLSSYLGKYAQIMRQTLESSYNDLVPIEQELDYLKNYLDLELLRQPGKFSYELLCTPDISPDELYIPSMVIQPFIENSIEHGFSSIETEGRIVVQFEMSGTMLRISITDNGKPSSAKQHKEYPSRAMQITRDRLYLLNKQHGSNAVFTLQDNEGSGKRVDIILPVLVEPYEHSSPRV